MYYSEKDRELCRKALDVALRSLENGNLPFGCLLADREGKVLLEGQNTVITSRDFIAHCEINLVHLFAGRYDFDFLNSCSVYASTEPCPMCSAALFWAGVGRLVYAVSKEGYKQVTGENNPLYHFPVSSKDLLASGGRKVLVEGPVLEEEGLRFYSRLSQDRSH
jgi:tRNA(Arg) A34 adenosine deaminase TadA